jgi:hypothetical protein
MSLRDDILAHLQPLVGLRLSIARLGGTMRGLHFGDVRPVERGTAGEYALHISCAWRLDGPEGVVTGSSDLWAYPGPGMPEDWDWEEGPNVQNERLAALLGGFDEATGSHMNATDLLVVEQVKAGPAGDARIYLSGGYRLILFPDGAADEHWRLFRPHTGERHFVVRGDQAGERP